MRRIKFRVWQPLEYVKNPGQPTKIKAGSNSFSEEIDGIFHCWGIGCETYNGATVERNGRYTIGIVEDGAGCVHKVLPEKIRFIEPVKYS